MISIPATRSIKHGLPYSDAENIHNYNITDDDESENDNMDDENTITYT